MKEKPTKPSRAVGTGARQRLRHVLPYPSRCVSMAHSIAYLIHCLSDWLQNRFRHRLPAAQSLKSRRGALVGFAAVASGANFGAGPYTKSHVAKLDSNDGDVEADIQANVQVNVQANAQPNECVAEGARLSKDCPPPPLHVRILTVFERGFGRFALLAAYACLLLSAPAIAQDPTPGDVDDDNDGLIEIYTLSDLNNIRHNLAGTSSKTSSGGAENVLGCPASGCNGYELMNDLNFDANGNGLADDGYNEGDGWEPIGTGAETEQFAATFDGNGYKIANLFISRDSNSIVGLFGALGSAGAIRNLGLLDATVTGDDVVGGLVGNNRGTITASYALATVTGDDEVGGLVGNNTGGGTITASYALATVEGDEDIGGLVGSNRNGTIGASYALATVEGNDDVGGLVGWNNISGTIAASYALATVLDLGARDGRIGGLTGANSGGTITASYAVATVSGDDRVGGLTGWNTGPITASYALATVTGSSNVGGLIGASNPIELLTPDGSYFDATFAGAMSLSDSASSRTTSELQMPRAYGTGDAIYASWNVDVGGEDTNPDDPWNFGSAMQYPALVLPPLATGACPTAISPAVMIGMTAGRCIHRPVSRFASVELDDDRGGRFDGIIFTDKRNPRIDAQLLLPVGSTVRVVAGTTEVLMPTPTDADRRVTLTVDLAEGRPNVFEALWVRESGEVSLGELAITLDMTTPTLTVFRDTRTEQFHAVATDAAPLTIRYARLDHASSDTCTQEHFSGRDLTDLTPYNQNPANADDRLLDALVPDSEGNVGVYCFVAEDAAGNRAVFSSANAMDFISALRLRLRVFLESALP